MLAKKNKLSSRAIHFLHKKRQYRYLRTISLLRYPQLPGYTSNKRGIAITTRLHKHAVIRNYLKRHIYLMLADHDLITTPHQGSHYMALIMMPKKQVVYRHDRLADNTDQGIHDLLTHINKDIEQRMRG